MRFLGRDASTATWPVDFQDANLGRRLRVPSARLVVERRDRCAAMSPEGTTAPGRSTFVTVVAWVFIALAGMATLMTALQSVMVLLLFPLDEIRQNAPQNATFETMPVWARFMFTHIELWFLFCFTVSATTVVAAIGLLRRRNWARILFVGVLAFGIVWNLVTPFVAAGMMPAGAFDGVDGAFTRAFRLMQAVTVALAVGVAALFAWLGWRLCSPAVRAEFHDRGVRDILKDPTSLAPRSGEPPGDPSAQQSIVTDSNSPYPPSGS